MTPWPHCVWKKRLPVVAIMNIKQVKLHSLGCVCAAVLQKQSLCCSDFCLCTDDFSDAAALFFFLFWFTSTSLTLWIVWNPQVTCSSQTPTRFIKSFIHLFDSSVVLRLGRRWITKLFCLRSLQFDPAPRRGEPHVTRRTPDYFLWMSKASLSIIHRAPPILPPSLPPCPHTPPSLSSWMERYEK